MDLIQKVILKEHPDYDFERYRFQPGDVVRTKDGALVLVEYSAIDYVSAFPLARSMKYRTKEFQKVMYTDLPYYEKGEFESVKVTPKAAIQWKVGDIVKMEDGVVTLLTKEVGHQRFHGFVLESPHEFYLHTSIYLESPWSSYIVAEG